MVTAHKAESKNEEIQHKVRARATVVTDLGEEVAELGQQIAKLMMALAKAGQSKNPSSALSSPWERAHGRGCSGSNTPVTQTPTIVGVALDRPFQPTPYPLGIGWGSLELGVMDTVTQVLAQGGRA